MVLSKDIKNFCYILASYFIDKPPSIDFSLVLFFTFKNIIIKTQSSGVSFFFLGVLYEFLVEHSNHEFMLMHGLFTLLTCNICVCLAVEKSCECVPLSWQRYNIYMTIQNECVKSDLTTMKMESKSYSLE